MLIKGHYRRYFGRLPSSYFLHCLHQHLTVRTYQWAHLSFNHAIMLSCYPHNQNLVSCRGRSGHGPHNSSMLLGPLVCFSDPDGLATSDLETSFGTKYVLSVLLQYSTYSEWVPLSFPSFLPSSLFVPVVRLSNLRRLFIYLFLFFFFATYPFHFKEHWLPHFQ